MRLFITFQYGSMMELTVKDMAEGMTRIKTLKNDGHNIVNFEFKKI